MVTNEQKLYFSSAVEKYVVSKRAKGFSENTINAYAQTFTQFQNYLGEDICVEEVNSETITRFLASCTHVSNKTKLNHHTGLSSLWAFLESNQIVSQNVVRKVERPIAESRQINPFTQHDIRALLSVAEKSQNPVRSKAIILILLDTGVRASELCQIKIRDIDFENRRILILGKGNKERSVPFSKIAQKIINNYLELRKINIAKDRNAHLFITKDGKPFNRFGLLNMIERFSALANVYPGHPHRFRHTFAIQFLRNGGSIYTLQRILGHSTLDMVKKYLSISQSDLDGDHELASPVKAWGLGLDV